MAEVDLQEPIEALFHKYPVLRIPTGQGRQELTIGLVKARAIVRHYLAILDFVNRHERERGHGE